MKNVILTTPCNHCIHSSIIEVDGVKRLKCESEELQKGRVKNDLLCTYSCKNYVPTEEQKAYDEYVRTHSVDYEEPKKRGRKSSNETMA